jgi:cell division protein FtsB
MKTSIIGRLKRQFNKLDAIEKKEKSKLERKREIEQLKKQVEAKRKNIAKLKK